MKITVEWEEADIVPGKRYRKSATTEEWIIGYMSTMAGDNRYVSISLTDGMVTKPRSLREFADFLTMERYVPTWLIQKEG